MWSRLNVVSTECGLDWMWSQLNVVSTECGLDWMWSRLNVVSTECGLEWMWSRMNVVSNECGHEWMWSRMNVVSNECGLEWMWSQMNVVLLWTVHIEVIGKLSTIDSIHILYPNFTGFPFINCLALRRPRYGCINSSVLGFLWNTPSDDSKGGLGEPCPPDFCWGLPFASPAFFLISCLSSFGWPIQ